MEVRVKTTTLNTGSSRGVVKVRGIKKGGRAELNSPSLSGQRNWCIADVSKDPIKKRKLRVKFVAEIFIAVHSAAEPDDLGGLPRFFLGGSPSSASSSFGAGAGGAVSEVVLGTFGGLPRGRLGLFWSAPSGFGW